MDMERVLLIQIDLDKSQFPELENRTTATESIVNEYNGRCKDRSVKFARMAAERFGWDYELVTERSTPYNSPCFEIFRIWTNPRYTQYDRILYLDTDVYYFPDSPNILEYYPNQGFHAVPRTGKIFDEGKEPDHLARIEKSHLVDQYKQTGYFNSGVILLDTMTLIHMAEYINNRIISEYLEKRGLWSDDQSMINIAAYESNCIVTPMHQYWNQMDKRYSDGYLVHLKGSIKNRENKFDERAEGYLNAISSNH